MTDLGWPELLIVAAIAMMLFGTKKMPEIARSLGRSMRIVKSELRGLKDDDTAATAAPDLQPVAIEPVAAPQPVTEPRPVATQPVDPAAGETPTR